MAAQEQDRTQGLIPRAGRHVSSCRQVSQKPLNRLRVHHRSLGSLLFRQIVQEASHPVAIGLLGAIGLVTRLNPSAELLHGPEWLDAVRSALAFRRGRLEPVRPAKKLPEVDLKGLLRLSYLPIGGSAWLQLFAELAHAVGQGLVGGRPFQEPAHPPHFAGLEWPW